MAVMPLHNNPTIQGDAPAKSTIDFASLVRDVEAIRRKAAGGVPVSPHDSKLMRLYHTMTPKAVLRRNRKVFNSSESRFQYIWRRATLGLPIAAHDSRFMRLYHTKTPKAILRRDSARRSLSPEPRKAVRQMTNCLFGSVCNGLLFILRLPQGLHCVSINQPRQLLLLLSLARP